MDQYFKIPSLLSQNGYHQETSVTKCWQRNMEVGVGRNSFSLLVELHAGAASLKITMTNNQKLKVDLPMTPRYHSLAYTQRAQYATTENMHSHVQGHSLHNSKELETT